MYSILLEIGDKDKVKGPAPMRTPAHQRNRNKYCHFHKEVGHETNECKHLKRVLDGLAAKGKLNAYLPSGT